LFGWLAGWLAAAWNALNLSSRFHGVEVGLLDVNDVLGPALAAILLPLGDADAAHVPAERGSALQEELR
jgi:hypothetical protein